MAHPNKYKYLKAPTIEQIEAVVAKAGVSDAQFERHYNIYEGTIKQVRMNLRAMPVHHWHLFFENTLFNGSRIGSKPTPQTPRHRTRAKADSRMAGLI